MHHLEHRRMTCGHCGGSRQDHPPDEAWLPLTDVLAWRLHARRHHTTTPVYVERQVAGAWQLVETIGY